MSKNDLCTRTTQKKSFYIVMYIHNFILNDFFLLGMTLNCIQLWRSRNRAWECEAALNHSCLRAPLGAGVSTCLVPPFSG